jgi:hypothetical protein
MCVCLFVKVVGGCVEKSKTCRCFGESECGKGSGIG